MYLYDKNRITFFAETDRRNKRIPFGIKAEDRTRHMYIIGKTGMGKSTLIENMAVQDIKNGEGFAFIDPHGKSAALLLDYIPPERVKDVIYFAPFDMDNPISFNIMEDVGPDKRHLVANGLMSVFKKLWVDAWSARMEYILSNVLLALLEYPEATLLGVNRMLADKAYRKKVVDNIKDPAVKAFWVDEYAKYSEKYTQEATPAIQNKIGQFTSNPLIRNIIGQPHSSFDLRKIMDERKILIVNLSKGQVGDGNANLLGSMLITKIYLAAMSRAELDESELKKLPNFYFYVDEFQSFANESFANILSEARKYKLALTMANQYVEQMSEEVTAAVFGNVGTQIMFRVGATDAEQLEKEYAPVFTAEDMVNLGFTQIYLKLMIDGVASHPFSAVTLPPIAPPQKSSKQEVITSSRTLYARQRGPVEKEINDWYGPTEVEVSSSSSTQAGKKGEFVPFAPVPRADKPGTVSTFGASAPQRIRPDGVARQQATTSVPASPKPAILQQQPTQPQSKLQPSQPQFKKEEASRVAKTSNPFAAAFKELEAESLFPEIKAKPQTIELASEPLTPELDTKRQLSEIESEHALPEIASPTSTNTIPVTIRKSPDANRISLTSLESKNIPEYPKTKGPRKESLNSLKSALADVLSEQKARETKHTSSVQNKEDTKLQPSIPTPIATKQLDVKIEIPSTPPAPPQAEPPRKEPVAVQNITDAKREEVRSEPIKIPHEESKMREVPEDVLTAILMGED